MTTEPLAEASDLHAHVFTLARLLKSADKALVILRVHELLQAQGFRALEDRKWVSYPLADWHEQHFTWAGKSKVRDLLDSLDHEHNLLIRTKERVFKDRPAYDRTVSYSLDYERIWALLSQAPDDLPTTRNKRLPADDPRKKQPLKVIGPSGRPLGAPAPDDHTPPHANKSTPYLLKLEPMLTAEDVEYNLSEPLKSPLRLKWSGPLAEDPSVLYWTFGGVPVARCSRNDYRQACHKSEDKHVPSRLWGMDVTVPRPPQRGSR